MYTYVYIYIYRERERYTVRVYVYIYIYIYIYTIISITIDTAMSNSSSSSSSSSIHVHNMHNISSTITHLINTIMVIIIFHMSSTNIHTSITGVCEQENTPTKKTAGSIA